jgi:predicted ester cyclase
MGPRAEGVDQARQAWNQGDLAGCRFTMTGVHRGDFMGVPAMQRPYQLPRIAVMRFGGDQMVERWSSADFLGLLTQLGAIPAPG